MSNIVFQPFPDKCPIPPDVVGYIGCIAGPAPTLVFRYKGKEIAIKALADPLGPPPAVYNAKQRLSPSNILTWKHYDRVIHHCLEIIATQLATIQWGEMNWAYLIPPMKNSDYRIVQRKKMIPKVTCPLWGCIIPISEVEFTVFAGMASDRRGIWRGKKCDIYVSWNDSLFYGLDRAMYALRVMEGMDLTFEFYGHLVDEEGNVIGIVFEAGWGRPITLADRNKVYAALAKIQRHGLLYFGCLTNRFLITNGKVRLTDMDLVYSFATCMEDVDQVAESWHWNELGQLFWELEHEDRPFGRWGSPSRRFTTPSTRLEYMPLPTSPELPLGNVIPFQNVFKRLTVPACPEYRKQSKGSVARKRLLTANKIEDEADDTENAIISIDSRDYEDRPLSVSVLYTKHQRRVQHHHPYSGRPRILIRESRAIPFSDASSAAEVSYSGGKNRSSWMPQ